MKEFSNVTVVYSSPVHIFSLVSASLFFVKIQKKNDLKLKLIICFFLNAINDKSSFTK